MTRIAELVYLCTVLALSLSFLAGRLFPFPKFLLLVCLAITPVPLLFLLRAAQP